MLVQNLELTAPAIKLAAASCRPGRRRRYFQIGAYVEHVPTGLFAYGAFGWLDQDGPALGYALGFRRGGPKATALA